MLKPKNYENLVMIGILLIFTVLSFLIVQPYITAILFGLILAYSFYPLYKWVNKRIKHKATAAILVSVFIVLVITVPLSFLANYMVKETVQVIDSIRKSSNSTKNLSYTSIFSDSAICDALGNACEKWPWVRESIDALKVREMIISFGGKIREVLTSIPNKILSVFIILFTTFYGFIDGKKLVRRIWRVFPFKMKDREILRKSFEDMVYAVVYSSLIVAVIQGALGGLGLWVFGIESWVIWMFVMMIASLIPYVGTALVWAPASLFLMWQGLAFDDGTGFWKGVGLFIYGVTIIGSIDNIIKPKLLGNRARVHPVIVLIGILGGLQFFGASGLIFGPLVLAIFMSILSISEGKPKGNTLRG